MRWLIEVAARNTDKPLAVDSEQPEIMAGGLAAVSERTAWINSISAESRRLESVLPLAKQYGAPVVALCMGDDGIPRDVAGRLKAAEKIYRRAQEAGVNPSLLYFDPLVMPIAADPGAGKTALESIQAIKQSFPEAKTVMGLSNVSFGLPLRATLNTTFLVLCLGAGLDAAILDPCNESLMMSLAAAEALMGKDTYCRRYIGAYQKRKIKDDNSGSAS
jgi:5-methyltetrahydrofolate--homocysteine methyltransferase